LTYNSLGNLLPRLISYITGYVGAVMFCKLVRILYSDTECEHIWHKQDTLYQNWNNMQISIKREIN
jgi:hypothetical protein